MTKNLNTPSTPPAKLVDWAKIREQHGKPDQRVIERHERILSELDSVPPERVVVADDKPAEQVVAEATAKLVKKSKRGGPRAGAGRKPNYLKTSGLPPILAHTILGQHDIPKLWSSLLNSKNEHPA